MTDADPDVVARLSWAVRRYLALIIVAVAGAVTLFVAGPVMERDRRYEAAALVVATSLEIDNLQVPRTMNAVFTAGAVAESVASQLRNVGPAHRLIPESIRLEPLNETIAARVIGESREPALAADLANAAAFYLVAELNRMGPGVGEFAVQNRATVPARGSESSSPVTALTLGVLSGAGLSLGLVGLLLITRRPVITGREAAAIIGAPLLVSLELPAGRQSEHVESVSGLSLLVKRMFPTGAGMCALVDTGRAAGPRREVMALVAELMSRAHPVRLVVPASDHRALVARTKSVSNVRVVPDEFTSDPAELVLASEGETAVLLGLSASGLDVPQLIPRGFRTMLLVTAGAARAEVESSATQFAAGDVDGVVFVKSAPWLERWRRVGGTAQATAPPAAPEQGEKRSEKATQ